MSFLTNLSSGSSSEPDDPLALGLSINLGPEIEAWKAKQAAQDKQLEEEKLFLRQFIEMHGDAFIGDELSAEGSASNTLTYWFQLLLTWISSEDLGISSGLGKEHLKNIATCLKQANGASQLLEKGDGAALHKALQEHFFKNNTPFFLPIKLKGHPHPMCVVFTLTKNEQIHVHILNRGEGSERHPLIQALSTKAKRSYRSNTFIFDSQDFTIQSKFGTSFFRQLAHRRATSDRVGEIYDLFSHGALKEIPPHISKADAVSPQRSQTGAEKIPELIIRDLLRLDDEQQKIKRVVYAARFRSLVEFRKKPERLENEEQRFILKNSLAGFAKWTLELSENGTISAEEQHVALELIKELTASCQKFETPQLPASFQPNPSFDMVPISSTFTIDESQHSGSKKPQRRPPNVERMPLQPLASPDQDLKAFIEGFRKNCALLCYRTESEENLHIAYQLISALPIPQLGDDFWSQIPEDEIDTTIDSLKELALFFHKRIVQQNDENLVISPSEALIGLHTCYACIHKLTLSIDQLGMADWGIPHNLTEVDRGFLVEEGAEHKRYCDLLAYFEGVNRKKDPERGNLFLLLQGLASSYDRFIYSTTDAYEKFQKKIPGKDKREQGLISMIQFLNAYANKVNKTENVLYPMGTLIDHWARSLYGSFSHLQLVLCLALSRLGESDRSEFDVSPSRQGMASSVAIALKPSILQYGRKEASHRSKVPLIHPSFDPKLAPPKGKRNGSENALSLAEFAHDTPDGADIWEEQPVTQEIAKLFSEELAPTRISSTLNWMSTHKNLLSDKAIQQQLQIALLEPQVLEKALEKEPELAYVIRKTFHEMIEHFPPSKAHIHTHLFWLRLAYITETRLQEIEKKSDASFIEYCQQTLQKTKKQCQGASSKSPFALYEIALLEIYFRGHQTKCTKKQILGLMHCWIEATKIAQTLEAKQLDKLKWLKFKCQKFLAPHANEVEAYLNNEDNCALFFEQSFPELEQIWEGQYPLFVSDGHEINVATGSLIARGKEVRNWGRVLGPDAHGIAGECGLSTQEPVLFNRTESTLTSLDGSVCIFGSYSGLNARRKINGRWYCLEKISQGSALDVAIGSHGCVLWKPEDPSVKQCLIGTHSGALFGCFTTGEESCSIERLDAQGKRTGLFLANPYQLVKTSLYEFLCGLFDAKLSESKMHVWVNEAGLPQCIELDEYQLDLRVINSKQGARLSLNTLPGFYLDPTFDAKKQLGIPKCLAFVNSRNERKILILQEAFELTEPKKYSTQLKKTSRALVHKEGRSMLFELNKTTGHLVASTPEAALYLVSLYAAQGKWAKAKFHLDQISSFSIYGYYEINVLEHLLKVISHPQLDSSAFCLHLAAHLIDNLDLFPAQARGEKYGNFEERLTTAHVKLWTKLLDHALFLCSQRALTNSRITHELEIDRTQLVQIRRFIESWNQEHEDALFKINEEKFQTLKTYLSTLRERVPVRFERSKISFKTFKGTSHIYASSIRYNLFRGFSHDLTIDLTSATPRPIDNKRLFNAFFQKFGSLKTPQEKRLANLYLHNLWHTLPPPSETQNQHQTVCIILALQMENSSLFKGLNPIDHLEKILNVASQTRPPQFLNDYVDLPDAPASKTRRRARLPKKKGFHTAPVSPNKLFMTKEKIGCPLGTVAKTHSSQKKMIPPKEEFALKDPKFNKKDESLECALYTSLQEGYKKYDNSYFYYAPVEAANFEQALKGEIDATKRELERLKGKIEKFANPPHLSESDIIPDEVKGQVDEIELRRFAKKMSELTFQEHVWPAFLLSDPSLLLKHNPQLKEEQIQYIFNLFATYLMVHSRYDQLQEVQAELNKEGQDPEAQLQAVGAILHKKRGYNPLEYPELAFYEYASGHILRPEQTELLKKIFQAKGKKQKQLLVEFQTGGGKTKVISVILMIKAIREGKLPIFYSPPSLVDITKKDLKDSLSLFFQKKVHVLDITLNDLDKLTQRQIDKICRDLRKWQLEGSCLVIVPETYHTLNILYQMSFTERGSRYRNIKLNSLMNFFKTQTIAIIDEAHQSANSLWEANVSLGEPTYLSEQEKDLFLFIYDALLGYPPLRLPNGSLVHEVLSLKLNQQGKVSPADLDQIFYAVATHLLASEPYKNSDPKVLRYLLDPNEIKPNSLKIEDPNTLNLMYARGLFTQILPVTLSVLGGFGYGPAVDSKANYEKPYVEGQAYDADFSSMDITFSFSCQGRNQRGLCLKDITQLMRHMVKGHAQAMMHQGFSIFEIQYNEWKKECPDLPSIEEIDPAETEQMEALVVAIGHHPQVIRMYLSEILFRQIREFSAKYSSNGSALVRGSAESTLFSATLGLADQYPLIEEKPFHEDDSAFLAAVLQRVLTSKQNQELHWLDCRGPRELFEDLWEKNPALFENLEGMADAGGWNIHTSTKEVAKAFLLFANDKGLNYQGVIYISENEKQEKILQYLSLESTDPEPVFKNIALEGSDTDKALAAKGISAPRASIFKIYGPNHCTGTDFKLSPRAKLLISISETSALYFNIQTIGRNRPFVNFLNDPAFQDTQSMVWVGSNKLKKMIPDVERGMESVIVWSLRKECEQSKERIIATAHQEISQAIQEYVVRICSKGGSMDHLQARKHLQQLKHHAAFRKVHARDIEALFGSSSRLGDASKVFNGLVSESLRVANIKPLSWQGSLEQLKVSQIIKRKVALVKKIRTQAFTTSASKAMEKNVSQAKAKAKNKRRRLRRGVDLFDPVKEMPYATKELSLHRTWPMKDGICLSKALIPLNDAVSFGTPLLSKNLFFMSNALFTDASDVAGKSVSHLKPISYFLVVFESGDPDSATCYVVSCHDAAVYAEQLRKNPDVAIGKCPKRKAILYASRGGCHAKGKSNLSLTTEQAQVFEQSEQFKRWLTEIAFLNGQVFNQKLLKELIGRSLETNPDAFFALWKRIQTIQHNPETVQVDLINYLIFQVQNAKDPTAAVQAPPPTKIEEKPKEVILLSTVDVPMHDSNTSDEAVVPLIPRRKPPIALGDHHAKSPAHGKVPSNGRPEILSEEAPSPTAHSIDLMPSASFPEGMEIKTLIHSDSDSTEEFKLLKKKKDPIPDPLNGVPPSSASRKEEKGGKKQNLTPGSLSFHRQTSFSHTSTTGGGSIPKIHTHRQSTPAPRNAPPPINERKIHPLMVIGTIAMISGVALALISAGVGCALYFNALPLVAVIVAPSAGGVVSLIIFIAGGAALYRGIKKRREH